MTSSRITSGGFSRRACNASSPLVAVRIQVHVAVSGGGRFFPAVYHHLEPVRRAVQQPEGAAADTGTGRLHNRQHGADGNSRIEGVTALGENFVTGLGGQEVRAGNGRFAGLFRRQQRRADQQQRQSGKN